MASLNRQYLLLLFGCVICGKAVSESNDIELIIRGTIESGTCVIDEDSTRLISLQEISHKDVISGKSSIIPNSAGEIRFECPTGSSAKFNFVASGEECTVETGNTYSCDGVNKSVGISPRISYSTPSGSRENYRVFNDAKDRARVNEVVLKDKAGIIKIDSVEISKVIDVPLSPGEFSANYQIKVFNF